jgi:ABC-type glycerol-3-phosphate transport system substrate-binding protein
MSDQTPPNNHNSQKKSISRRDFLRLGAAGLAAGVATSLGANPANAASKRSPLDFPFFSRQQKVNLRILTWMKEEPGRGKAWQAMLDKYNASQTDISVELAGWQFNEYTNQILLQVKSGAIDGDMFMTTPDLVQRLKKENQLEPLQDIIDKLGLTKVLSKAHDSIRDADGKVLGLDIVTVGFGLMYNSKMFADAGVSEPKSIDEWVDVSTKLTKRPDQFGIYSPHLPSEPEAMWFILQQWAVLFGGVWAEGQKPMVTSDAVVNGLKLFKTMFDKAMPQGTDEPTAIRMGQTGRLGQFLIVSAAVNVWKDEGPDVYPHLRSAMPFWPSKQAITRIHPLCVNINGQQKDASKAFVEWLYTTDNYRELLERQLDVIPAFPDGIRKEYLDSLFWSAGYQAATPITPPEIMGEFIFYNQEFGNIVNNQFQQVLTGGVSVEDAMGAAQTELEAMAARVFA